MTPLRTVAAPAAGAVAVGLATAGLYSAVSALSSVPIVSHLVAAVGSVSIVTTSIYFGTTWVAQRAEETERTE